MTKLYDFLIATDCELDSDFVRMLEQAAQASGLTTYLVKPYNLGETLALLYRNEVAVRFYYDRASDTSPQFLRLYHLMLHRHIPVLDTLEQLNRAADKATMHLEFIANGIYTPHTIILPPLDKIENINLATIDLSRLGFPFIIKPANTTGGGVGVINGAHTLQDVLQARQVYQNDKYLLQEKVVPTEKDGRRFWFRCFYACGKTDLSWWDDRTHVYEVTSQAEIERYELAPLFQIVQKIENVSHLHFFSTEIAQTVKGDFVVVDYVNEICDMRLKSRYVDGVPDEIVEQIATHIVLHVKDHVRTSV